MGETYKSEDDDSGFTGDGVRGKYGKWSLTTGRWAHKSMLTL